MTARRCALYMVAAVLHDLDEVWVSPQPILLFMYIAQYVPVLPAPPPAQRATHHATSRATLVRSPRASMGTARYLPTIGMWIGKRVGPKRVRAYKGGDSGYQMFTFNKLLGTGMRNKRAAATATPGSGTDAAKSE